MRARITALRPQRAPEEGADGPPIIPVMGTLPPIPPERPPAGPWPRVAHLTFLLSLAAVAAACGGGDPAQGFRLYDAVVAGRTAEAGLSLPGEAKAGDAEIADERRRSVALAAAPWSWRGRVPEAARFALGVQLLPLSREGIESLEVRVEALRRGEREVLAVGRSREPGWLDLAFDLDDYGGREVTLEVIPELRGPGAGDGRPRRLVWSPAALAPREPLPRGRPNVLFIVVDTLRADRLTPYGYSRTTSPEIQARLADRGVVVERAYAQAPWTLPSVASYMTGRYPGDFLGASMAAYGIPEGTIPLGERMASLGYETGAFYANFTLRDANGFGRGFSTRYTPPADPESNKLHADSVNARAIPWLEAHQHRPFFLYVHYMDPHDPYDNPDLIDGRSPFYLDYDGPISGRWVHGVYTGRIPLPDPERDVAHLSALYDSEIAYVDRHIGELLDALDPEVAARTLIVFTSDHGEELYDHGGFKHGQTLYDEQIRVPLILRWDGRLPAGERLAGTVRLLDLAPTLAAAVGGEADPAWEGENLLPALAGEERPPRRPAFAQHLGSGPLRAAAVYEGKKVILFNRERPFTPEDQLIEHLWSQDLRRLARREAYDLVRDPGETGNLAAPGGSGSLPPLERVIHRRLDAALPGLRLAVAGLPPESRVTGRIVFQQPPESWLPYFLAPEDRVRLEGPELTFDLAGEDLEKGLTLAGDVGGLVSAEARLAGGGEAVPVLLGAGDAYRGGEVPAERLLVSAWPPAPDGPALRLWRRVRDETGEPEVSPEVEESLRTLGYVE